MAILMAMNTKNGNGHHLTEQLRAVADPTRRRILRMLGEKGHCSIGESTGLCARDIEAKIKLSQPTVSHHMKILADAGLITGQRRGQWTWYRRDETAVRQMTKKFREEL
ncbi:ArsR/SmtB family transcription factor [Candidatus Korobacter versatilis]|nr:metalloregulator ArsR/SmtB family transcription factor [Candidatus Koribacter versatilis]